MHSLEHLLVDFVANAATSTIINAKKYGLRRRWRWNFLKRNCKREGFDTYLKRIRRPTGVM